MMAPELFASFTERRAGCEGGEAFARGSGPPLELLHGYAETHLMWDAEAVQRAQLMGLLA